MFIALLLSNALQPNIVIGGNLTPPALVAGPWEQLVAPGKVIGFSLEITTDAREDVRFLRLDTYVRKNGKATNTYWSTGNPGSFDMQSGQLRFHQARVGNQGFDVALDLTYDPNAGAWRGSFRDPFFRGQVTLRRPHLSDRFAPVGTWRTHSEVVIMPTGGLREYACLNIGEGQDGALVLWQEDHNVYVTVMKAGSYYGDSYGELLGDSESQQFDGAWSFVAGTGSGGEKVTGALSSDGSSFGGYTSHHYGNGGVDTLRPRHPFSWTRMLSLACRP